MLHQLEHLNAQVINNAIAHQLLAQHILHLENVKIIMKVCADILHMQKKALHALSINATQGFFVIQAIFVKKIQHALILFQEGLVLFQTVLIALQVITCQT